jgi:hypothetical protein
MSFLRDVAYAHVYQDRTRTRSSAHVLHPFTNSIGEHKGKYEILRKLDKGQKLSAHVIDAQLVEMFAHECFALFNIRLRMKDPSGTYPSSAPGLHPSQEHLVPGSDFSKAVSAFDTRAPLSSELKSILSRLGVQL